MAHPARLLRQLIIAIALLGGTAGITYAQTGSVTGIVVGTSPDFGNVWTSITSETFDELGLETGVTVSVTIARDGEAVFDQAIDFVETYGDVERGEPLILHDDGMMTIAISFGNFTETHGIEPGDEWVVTVTAP